MASLQGSRIIATVVAAAVAIGVGGVVVSGGGGTPPLPVAPTSTPGGGAANLWVDTTGGTCTRQSIAGAYSDAGACATLDNAFDAASNSDVVRIKDGTYGGQTLSGTKTGVDFIGESSSGTIFTDTVALVDNTTLESVTAVNDAHHFGPFSVSGTSNVTLKDANGEGDFVEQYLRNVQSFQWIGGRFGDFDGTIAKRICNVNGVNGARDGEPFFIGVDEVNHALISNHVLVEGLHFSGQLASGVGENGCGVDNFHLEMIRFDGGSDDIIIRRNFFDDNDANSGQLFFTNFEGGNYPTNVKIVGNVINDNPNTTILVPGGCANYILAYNTFRTGSFGSWTCSSYTGVKFVGNLGPRPASDTPACNQAGMTWSGNVTQDTSDSSCGGTFVSGPAFGSGNLGLSASQHLNAGSAGIDAAETPSANDICTDTSIMGTLGDIDGEARPNGTKCDAGADER